MDATMELRLREDQGDERFADRINAETEAFKRERTNQNEIGMSAAEHDGRCDVGPDDDFRGGHGLRHNRAVSILHAASAERRDADLFEEPAWDLGEIGARVNDSFQLELATGITWIAESEFHVEGPIGIVLGKQSTTAFEGLAMNSRTAGSGLKAGSEGA